jgi:hypothetical protein
LLKFTRQFDFPSLHPANEVVKPSLHPGVTTRVLAGKKTDYIIYVRTGLGSDEHKKEFKTQFAKGELSLEVSLPAGKFTEAWFDPKTGILTPGNSLSPSAGFHTLAAPAFEDDIALVIRAVK